MKDKSSPEKQDESLFCNVSQGELRIKINQWQETEKLLRLLVFRLSIFVNSPDPVLTNNLQLLRNSLRQGDDILQLNPLVADISNRIKPLVNNVVTSGGEIPKDLKTDDAEIKKQVYLLHDLLLVLLENINFPSIVTEEIKKIIDSLRIATDDSLVLLLIAGITALGEILDDVFCNVKNDKQKVGLFLKQVNIDLQDLGEGLAESNNLQAEKLNAEDEINSQMETHILEMENVIANLSDDEQTKQDVQGSINAIRGQMEKFKYNTTEYNQQTSEMLDRLRNQVSIMETQYEDLKRQIIERNEQSLSDPVTGIRNRLAYEEAIYLEVERYKRYGRPFTLLMFDLDNFKKINADSIGQSIGDKVLQAVANIMAANIRSVDFLARYGDDEFVIILPELGREDGKRVGAKICKAVQEKSFNAGGKTIRITVSGGIATIKNDDSTESLFERVDLALYLAKEKGCNRCEVD